MEKIIIIPNKNKDVGLSVTSSVAELLISVGITVYIERSLAGEITCAESVEAYDGLPRDAELIIVVGGDGSVIDASRYAVELDIPLVGVNLGRVGYLSEIEPDKIQVLRALKSGEYYVEERMLLSVLGNDGRFAVNDVVISHESYLGIGDFKVEDSNGNCVKYRADGIILSTPQGSTAYSLSAGGPIVAHNVDSITMTPVAPHSFFNRSVLFNASDVIKVTNIGETELKVSIDGRFVGTLAPESECSVFKASKRIKMLTFSKNSMFSCLFKKMRIMEDI